MLDLIRKHRLIFMTIFVLSAAGMIISMFGAPGRNSSGGHSMSFDSGVAAKVDGEEITTQDLTQLVSRQIEQSERMVMQQVEKSENKAETRRFMEQLIRAQVTPDRMLEELIREKFKVQTATSLGLETPPDVIRDMIQQNPYFQKNGHFDPLLYKSMVTQPGLYESELATEAKSESLKRVFDAGMSVVSPDEKQEDALLNQKRNYETLTVHPASFPEPKTASEADIKTFLARPDATAKLQTYYNRNVTKFQSAEQVHARHILIKDVATGEAKIKKIADDIKTGKTTFDAAAKQFSEDKSNSGKGGDLGFFGKGVMDKAFEAAAFALNKGQMSQPVKSAFGWHLIQVDEKKPAVNRTFEMVKSEIAPEVVLAEKKDEEARAWVKQVTSTSKVPSDADLKKLGLSWSKTEWSPLESRLGPVASVDDHRKELLALSSEKPILGSTLTMGDGLVIVKYDGLVPPPDESKDATKDLTKNLTVAKGKTAEKAPEKKPAPRPVASEESLKSQKALEFFMHNRMDELEKSKRIVRSERVLSDLRAALKTGEGAGGG